MKIVRKEFTKGYYCVSPFWSTCQLDCSDCQMLRKTVGVGINGEPIGVDGEREG